MSAIPHTLQTQVAAQSQNRCSYCQSQQRVRGVALTVDHIIPQSIGGETTIENLCLACWDCNLAKGDRVTAVDPQTGNVARLFHPLQQKWTDHFRWDEDAARIIGTTPTGRATNVALRLNRPPLVESRQCWAEVGWHPPDL